MNYDYVFPFAAIIGQEKAKKALLLNLINPKIGGVLLSGEKGTAKSTLVRGMAVLMKGMKVINLPLNTTEDRLIGTIDIEKTITQGRRSFQPGILKEAHGNILYVDEVNLLSEHLVNCILQVASSGLNKVEREGISVVHPCQFVLVGTMNPEEGNIRSQFLDRFGLFVEIKGCEDLYERKEIIKRRLEYERSPLDFIEKWRLETDVLSQQIKAAKKYLSKVQVSDNVMKLAAELAKEANCAGHRAELVIIETARAIAAYEKRSNISVGHIKEAAEYTLPHRKREKTTKQELPPETPEMEEQKESNEQQSKQPEEYEPSDQAEQEEESEAEQQEDPNTLEPKQQEDGNSEVKDKKEENDEMSIDQIDDIGRTFIVKNLDIKAIDRKKRKGEGKRIRTKTDAKKGQYIRYKIPKNKLQDIAFDATLRAAAPYQAIREKKGLAITIDNSDFREKVREKRTGSTIIFIVDASGSMGAKKRMSAVKGAIVSLLTDAYQKRDKVGLIAFRKKEADVLLNITRSVDMAEKCLKTLPTGGKTPLSAGLFKGYEVIRTAQKKNPDMLPIIVLVSDGRTNASINGGDPFEEAMEIAKKIRMEGIRSIVVDTEQGFIKLGIAKDIANALGALYCKLEELEGEQLAEAVRQCAIDCNY
ncbi:magnesium chelatase subunit D family protein [Lutispora thermophila]|uniref:Magnesium chelatase subunit D n=1 Tax=Lutispora thermophila DSM 19022 TaxID=1122184 RepID=A0A1M6H9D2_9FIRM|nr:magnesium chelatase subunit D family protein [Lutispora thermophila]SHJ18693.1 magnesium chelatase subunit D [Lutispora thermophila DSM 19022]